MFNLVCVHPHGKYVKGQTVTDDEEIKQLMADDRDHYFVRVARPEPPPEPVVVAAPHPAPVSEAKVSK